jgi:hypothetical protein
MDANREHQEVVSTAEFMKRLIDHIPDRYQHVVRYFGLPTLLIRSQQMTV